MPKVPKEPLWTCEDCGRKETLEEQEEGGFSFCEECSKHLCPECGRIIFTDCKQSTWRLLCKKCLFDLADTDTQKGYLVYHEC